MRKRQEKEEREKRILAKKVRARKFKGARTTPSNHWNFIREKQLELMAKGIDEEIALLYAKRDYRREQKHLKAFLKGHESFVFGKKEDEKSGQMVPNRIYVL